MRWQALILYIIILAGFGLRVFYLTTSHPFYDEYTTVLAARQVLALGWPVLPSGLFYEHGLLATYLAAPFTALFIYSPVGEWQPAQWGLMLSRWPSLLAGTLTIPLVYWTARRWTPGPAGPAAALLAAGLFAFSPEGVVWGGRARMYALATLLALLAAAWAYRGVVGPAPARYRWAALLALLAVLLTQFGVMILVPPLLVGLAAVGWLSARSEGGRPWFVRPGVLGEGLGLAAVTGLAVLVKRLGQPLGAAALADVDGTSLSSELADTVAYQTTLHFTWPDTVRFLARQFGPPHLYWLAVAAVAGGLVGLLLWRLDRRRTGRSYLPALFLWLVFGLLVVEMVTLLEPFRRNPRYLVMYLPLFYIIVAKAVFNFPAAAGRLWPVLLTGRVLTLLAVGWLFLFTAAGYRDLRIALVTPEPAYDTAFTYVRANWQPGDVLLTMNTPAAGLYMDRADGFTVQSQAEQFLLRTGSQVVDRWLGAPWVGTAEAFNAVLSRHPRVWFVIDTIRLPEYFRGDWQALVSSQMAPAWSGDNALVYLSRPGRLPLPAGPDTRLEVTLDQTIRLAGYSLQPLPDEPHRLRLTLFWQPLAPVTADYTVFVHLRDRSGAIAGQHDGPPLAGAYPTSQWQPGETVVDPLTLELPPGPPGQTYTLWVGLYDLDTQARLPVLDDVSGENAIQLGEVTLP